MNLEDVGRVNLIIRCYELLAPVDHQWRGRLSNGGQKLLSDLCAHIAAFTGETEEEIQNRYSMLEVRK